MSRLKLFRLCGGVLACFVTIGAARSQPPKLMSPYRTWKDASGSFETVAALEKVEQGNVLLRLKENNTTVPVPLERLSPADQAYVKDLVNPREETTQPPSDDVAATTVIIRRDFGSSGGSTDSGVLVFADERFGYVQTTGTMRFPGFHPRDPGRPAPRIDIKTPVNPGAGAPKIELPADALDVWRATFHYGKAHEFVKMLQPVMAGDRPVANVAKVPVGRLPAPLLSRETALPVAGSEVKIVGFQLQGRTEAAPYILRRTCTARVAELKGDAAKAQYFVVEGEELANISSGVVLDGQDRVLGIVLRGEPSRAYDRSRSRSTPTCRVRTVRSLRSDIAPTLQVERDASVVYAEGWSGSSVSLDFDVWIWDRLGRAGKMALLVKRHSGPLPAATQTSVDDWVPILPDMVAVPLASAPDDPSSSRFSAGRVHLAGKWQDSQGVDGQHVVHYAAQLQWTDAAGKVHRSAPGVLIPRLCVKAAWNKMHSVLSVYASQQAAPAPDGTILLTSESTRGWPGQKPFITELGASDLKATSPGTKLETIELNVGNNTCRAYRENEAGLFFRAPVWSSDGTAFFLLTANGLLRKVAVSDFRVLRSVQLTGPPEPRRRRAIVDVFPSSEGPIVMVMEGLPAKFWVLDDETLAVKRGFLMPAMSVISSLKSPIIYVPNINGLTMVDVSTGKVLRHMGNREEIREVSEHAMDFMEVGGSGPQISPDGQYLVVPVSSSHGETLPQVYRIDKDLLTFDPEAAAAVPRRMTRQTMLGLSLGQQLESAAREARARVPSDLVHNLFSVKVAVSPNGKEMLMTARLAVVYASQLPDTSEIERREAERRKAQ